MFNAMRRQTRKTRRSGLVQVLSDISDMPVSESRKTETSSVKVGCYARADDNKYKLLEYNKNDDGGYNFHGTGYLLTRKYPHAREDFTTTLDLGRGCPVRS